MGFVGFIYNTSVEPISSSPLGLYKKRGFLLWLKCANTYNYSNFCVHEEPNKPQSMEFDTPITFELENKWKIYAFDRPKVRFVFE